MRSLIALIGSSLLVGCSTFSADKEAETTTSDQTEQTVISQNKYDRVNRQLDVTWNDLGRGGAAVRQPAYIHTLNGQSHTQTSTGTKPAETDFAKTLGAYHTIEAGKAYSHYELSRWERFCQNGKGMDERDWKFVDKEGTNAVPRSLLNACTPPTYAYQDYLQAWTQYCTSSPLTASQRAIVGDSSRPYSVVNPCQALQ